MDRVQLRRELESSGVRQDSYSIDCPSNEAYCLEQAGGQWVVYYYERGVESGKKTFSSEGDACDYLLGILKDDPTARKV